VTAATGSGAAGPSGGAVASRTLVLGVVNVTPDSFSDGGRWFDTDAAVEHGLGLLAQGADALDVGGESTRPGAERVPEAEELRRVVPVVESLVAHGAVVSVDTLRASVAAAAVEAGAGVVNDVSGALADPEMVGVLAETGVRCVLSHWRGHSREMSARAGYDDVVAEVRSVLTERVAAVVEGGVAPEQVVVDPGLGFAKNADHNWALLAALPALVADGVPVLVGASRKRFLGDLLDGRRPEERDDATTAVTTMAAAAGAWGVRVHAVRPSADAVRVVQRWTAG
jgi:dihydropteroate synthase